MLPVFVSAFCGAVLKGPTRDRLSWTVQAPANVESGNLLVLTVYSSINSSHEYYEVPDGWRRVIAAGTAFGSTLSEVSQFCKITGPDEPATYDFAVLHYPRSTAAREISYTITQYKDFNLDKPISNWAEQTFSAGRTSWTTPTAYYYGVSDVLQMFVIHHEEGSSAPTMPAGYTLRATAGRSTLDSWVYDAGPVGAMGTSDTDTITYNPAAPVGSCIVMMLPQRLDSTQAPLASSAPTFSFVGASKITLNWTTGTDGVDAADTFQIWRSTGDGAASLIKTLASGARAYSDLAVVPGTTYTYYVVSVNAFGSATSPTAAMTTIAADAPARAAAPFFTGVTGTGATVAFGDNSTHLGRATTWHVERATSDGSSLGAFTRVASNVTSGSFTDSGLTAGQRYAYRMVAANGAGEGPAGHVSFLVPSATARVDLPPAPMRAHTYPDGGRLSLQWSPRAYDAVTGWEIWREVNGQPATLYATISTQYATRHLDLNPDLDLLSDDVVYYVFPMQSGLPWQPAYAPLTLQLHPSVHSHTAAVSTQSTSFQQLIYPPETALGDTLVVVQQNDAVNFAWSSFPLKNGWVEAFSYVIGTVVGGVASSVNVRASFKPATGTETGIFQDFGQTYNTLSTYLVLNVRDPAYPNPLSGTGATRTIDPFPQGLLADLEAPVNGAIIAMMNNIGVNSLYLPIADDPDLIVLPQPSDGGSWWRPASGTPLVSSMVRWPGDYAVNPTNHSTAFTKAAAVSLALGPSGANPPVEADVALQADSVLEFYQQRATTALTATSSMFAGPDVSGGPKTLLPITDDAYTGEWTTGAGSGSPVTVFWSRVRGGLQTWSPLNPAAGTFFSVKLDAPAATPGVRTGHVIGLQQIKNQTSGKAISCTVELLQGYPGTVIASQTYPIEVASGGATTMDLTEAQASAITNYSDLHVRVTPLASGGGGGRYYMPTYMTWAVPAPAPTLSGYPSLVATSSLTSTGTTESGAGGATVAGAAALVASSMLSSAGDVAAGAGLVIGSAVLTSASALSSTGLAAAVGSATFSATSSLSTTGERATTGTATLSADSLLTTSAVRALMAAADLAADANLSASSTLTRYGDVALSSSSTFTIDSEVEPLGSVALTADASLSADAQLTRLGDTALVATSTLATGVDLAVVGAAALAADADLSASGTLTRFAEVDFTGSSTFAISAEIVPLGSASLAADSSLSVNALAVSLGGAALSATATLSAQASLTSTGAVAMTAAAQLTVDASATRIATAALLATSSFAAAGTAASTTVTVTAELWEEGVFVASLGTFVVGLTDENIDIPFDAALVTNAASVELRIYAASGFDVSASEWNAVYAPEDGAAAELIATSSLTVSADVTAGFVVVDADAALQATSTLFTSGVITRSAAVALVASSTLTADAAAAAESAAALVATSTLATAGDLIVPAPVALVADSTFSSTAAVTSLASLALTASSSLSASAAVAALAAVALVSTSDLAVSAEAVPLGASTLQATSTFTASALVSTFASVTLEASASLSTAASIDTIAAAALVATSVLSIDADAEVYAALALAATATLSVSADVTGAADATLIAVSVLSTSGVITTAASATLEGASILSVSAQIVLSGSANLAATSTLGSTGILARTGSAALAAAAALTVAAQTTAQAAAALVGTSTLAVASYLEQLATASLVATSDIEIASQGIQLAKANLVATSMFAIAAVISRLGAAALEASSVLTLATRHETLAQAALESSTSLEVSSVATSLAAAELVGAAELLIAAEALRTAIVVLEAVSLLSAEGARAPGVFGFVSLIAEATMIVAGIAHLGRLGIYVNGTWELCPLFWHNGVEWTGVQAYVHDDVRDEWYTTV